MSRLTDARFKIVDEPSSASIFWLIGINRSQLKVQAQENNGYLNEFASDEVLLVKDLLVSLIYSTYKCFKQPKVADFDEARRHVIPETFEAGT